MRWNNIKLELTLETGLGLITHIFHHPTAERLALSLTLGSKNYMDLDLIVERTELTQNHIHDDVCRMDDTMWAHYGSLPGSAWQLWGYIRPERTDEVSKWYFLGLDNETSQKPIGYFGGGYLIDPNWTIRFDFDLTWRQLSKLRLAEHTERAREWISWPHGWLTFAAAHTAQVLTRKKLDNSMYGRFDGLSLIILGASIETSGKRRRKKCCCF